LRSIRRLRSAEAKDVFARRGIGVDQLATASPALLPLNEAAEADRAARVGQQFGAAVPGILGEYARRVAVSQELTVAAALSGDRTLVFEAMLADPIAGRLPFEQVESMTTELLTALAPWLPQFNRAR